MDEGAIRPVVLADAESIARIYNQYIARSTVTFEESRLEPVELESRIRKLIKRYPWLVFESEGGVRGYAYAGPYHVRVAYRHTVEISVYVEGGIRAKGDWQAFV